MAVDKKSDFVGDHGGKYVDQDGITKQFTYVDHDVKPKISTSSLSSEEKDNIQQSLKDYRLDLISRLTSLHASTCPFEFLQFTKRGDKHEIEWDIDMILDDGVPINVLRDLTVLTEKRNNM